MESVQRGWRSAGAALPQDCQAPPLAILTINTQMHGLLENYFDIEIIQIIKLFFVYLFIILYKKIIYSKSLIVTRQQHDLI